MAREDVTPGAVLFRHANRPRARVLSHLGAPGAHAGGAHGPIPTLGPHTSPRARAEGSVVRGQALRAARHVRPLEGDLWRPRRRGCGSIHGGDGERRALPRRPGDQHVPVQERVRHRGGPVGLRRVQDSGRLTGLARGGDGTDAKGPTAPAAQRVFATGPRGPRRLLPADRDAEDVVVRRARGLVEGLPELALRRLLRRQAGYALEG